MFIEFLINYSFVLSSAFLYYLAIKRNGGKFNRMFWAAVGLYFGPFIIPFALMFNRKGRGDD